MERFKSKTNEAMLFLAVLVAMLIVVPSGANSSQLASRPRIKEIIIEGGFPLLEQEIRNAMTITTGAAYISQELDKERDNIERLFQSEGYIDPKVAISAEEDPEDGNYSVRIRIEPGKFFAIQKLNINGNHAFSDLRLKMRLSSWQKSLLFGSFARLDEAKLADDIHALQKFYWKKGYADAVVESDMTRKTEKGEVEIDINIDEGPRYVVEMDGNDFFWNFTLKRELTIFEQGAQGDFNIKRSVRNLMQRYRNAGFQDVRIDTKSEQSEKKGTEIRRLRFLIQEGLRYIVGSVNIDGNKAFADDKILKQMLTRPPRWLASGKYVPDDLSADILAIRALYIQNGYTEPRIEHKIRQHPDNDSDQIEIEVDIHIEEGPQTMVSRLEIGGLSGEMTKNIRKDLPLQKGDPYRERLMENSRNTIASRVSEQGYPHVEVDNETLFTDDGTRAHIKYDVRKGPYVEMGQTYFAGNFRTRTKVLESEMVMEAGEAFSLSKMLSSQRNIRNINALETVRFQTSGLEEQEERVDMLVEVAEKPPYFLELAAGYDTRRLFYVKTGGGDINLWGLNKRIHTEWEFSQIGYAMAAGLNDPKFFGTDIGADASLHTEKTEEQNKDFGLRKTGLSVHFSRTLGPNIDGGLGFGYDYREQYPIDKETTDADEVDQYESRSVLTAKPTIDYDSTDSFIRPTRGINSQAALTVSKGIENKLDDFFKYELSCQSYYTPLDRITFALRGRGSHLEPYGENETVPDDQLFFLGGTAGVRGFEENRLRVDTDNDPVGGRAALMASLEARLDIGMNFEFVSFYDTGTIRKANRDAGSNDWRTGIGGGLRYISPIGALGLMHGWKVDPRPGEKSGAYHFTIGYAF